MERWQPPPEPHRFIDELYESGHMAAIVCHATCTLRETRPSDGFWIREEACTMEETNFVVSALGHARPRRPGRLPSPTPF